MVSQWLSSGAGTRMKPALEAADTIVKVTLFSGSSKSTTGPDPLTVTEEKIGEGHHEDR